jgi:hypothetical protein
MRTVTATAPNGDYILSPRRTQREIDSDRDEADRKQKQAEQDRREQYVNAYRVLVGGVVVDAVPMRLGECFCLSLCNSFADNLRKAQTDPTWKFNGTLSGPEWLRGHQLRLGCSLQGTVQVVPPGELWPLAPNLGQNV